MAWFGRLRIEIRHAAHPAQIANEAPFRKKFVDLDRPQIPHSLPVASFRKMVVDLDRLHIPHRLPMAPFGVFRIALDICVLPTVYRPLSI